MDDRIGDIISRLPRVEGDRRIRRSHRGEEREQEVRGSERYVCASCGCSIWIPVGVRKPIKCHNCGDRHWDDDNYTSRVCMTREQAACMRVLNGMIIRCYDESCPSYKYYGGKGVGITPLWYDSKTGEKNIDEFAKWCYEHGWKRGLQIDRIDNAKGYCPENCRIVTAKENLRNKTNNVYVKIGEETRCIGEWSEISGLPYSTLRTRFSRGWDSLRAITIPAEYNRPHECFFKSLNGKRCLRGECVKKCGKEGSAMRGCEFFWAYQKGVDIPYR